MHSLKTELKQVKLEYSKILENKNIQNEKNIQLLVDEREQFKSMREDYKSLQNIYIKENISDMNQKSSQDSLNNLNEEITKNKELKKQIKQLKKDCSDFELLKEKLKNSELSDNINILEKDKEIMILQNEKLKFMEYKEKYENLNENNIRQQKL